MTFYTCISKLKQDHSLSVLLTMKSFLSSFSLYLAFTAITWGCLVFAQPEVPPAETSSDINPILDSLFIEWMKKQQVAQPVPESAAVPSDNLEDSSQVVSPAAPQPPSSPQEPPTEPPAVPPASNPVLPQFASNPFFPQLPVNPALGALPPSPYFDPTMLNPYLFPYGPFGPFSPFPMKIKKKKV